MTNRTSSSPQQQEPLAWRSGCPAPHPSRERQKCLFLTSLRNVRIVIPGASFLKQANKQTTPHSPTPPKKTQEENQENIKELIAQGSEQARWEKFPGKLQEEAAATGRQCRSRHPGLVPCRSPSTLLSPWFLETNIKGISLLLYGLVSVVSF